MKNANEVRCADCGGHVKSEEVLKAEDQLDALRVSLEIEEIKKRTEAIKLGRSEEVLKAKEQLDALQVSLEIEETKQRIEVLKLRECVNSARRDEQMNEVMSQFALEIVPELKVVIQALALVLTAHIKDMGPDKKEVVVSKKK